LRIEPISLLDPADYEMTSSKNFFLPDARESLPENSSTGMIEGFGLRWLAQLPAQESTVQHCQKLLQVDRETGLLDFVDEQRNTFTVADNIEAINTQRDLLLSANGGFANKLSRVAGVAFGIFSLFSLAEQIMDTQDNDTQQSL